ncbi:MAG: App1 family protein [Telluria sp.]
MPFLVLTRAGFDDIAGRHHAPGTTLHLNPGVASDAEIASLRSAGAEVHMLASALDPEAPAEAIDIAGFGDGAGPLWIERTVPTRKEAAAAPPPHSSPEDDKEHEALHHRLAKNAGALAGGALRRLGRLGRPLHPMVIPYLGFGNAERLRLQGRVLSDEAFKQQSHDDSRWSNVMELYRRLESDEVADARVVARFQGREYDAVTDRGGYFSFDITLPEATGAGWHTVDLVLPDHRAAGGEPVAAAAEVLVPPASARFGVISDIDDTVLWTNVTNKINMALMLARSNAHTRKPFKGVAAFYRALHEGADGRQQNPVFYVSSSPWHLFGPLTEFMRVQGIPTGPLMLRELGLSQLFKLTQHSNHKLDKIELILSMYPGLQFVLIGDSGEQDPEIYTEVVRRHPKSVRVIYIRNVNPDPSRIEALDKLIEEVSATGVQLVLSPDSVFAATHAAGEGLIHVDSLAAVRSDKKHDEAGTKA